MYTIVTLAIWDTSGVLHYYTMYIV